MQDSNRKQILWWALIGALVITVSVLHYTTPTMKWQYHLIYMQSYFIPILIAAFQFGVRGGLGTAIAVSLIYFPHIMMQWGGLVESNLLRFLQIALFNVIGYITGLKAQKEMQEKLRYRKTADELQRSIQLLKQQSEKLEEMEEQLRLTDRLAVVGELTASLAHEVRNPLGSIRGTVEILRDELPDDEKNSEFFRILVEETNRLSNVVENYLSFSRRQKRQVARSDLKEIVRNVKTLLASRARKEGVDIELVLPEKPVMIDIDPDQMRQVLVNLLLNSIQAMPDGGIVKLKTDYCQNKQPAQSTEVENRSKNSGILLSILDQGQGMRQEELDKIFKPFYTTKPNGTGLGLAIVKRLADQNRWELNVSSQPGKGTSFSIYIPVTNN